MLEHDFNNVISKYYNSLNLFKGFMIGIGIRYVMDTTRCSVELLAAIITPGLYCGLRFFKIYRKYK